LTLKALLSESPVKQNNNENWKTRYTNAIVGDKYGQMETVTHRPMSRKGKGKGKGSV